MRALGACVACSLLLATAASGCWSTEATVRGDEPRLGCRFGSFGPAVVPGACWRPFSRRSPFNQLLPPRPRLLRRSAAVTAGTVGFGPPEPLLGGVSHTRDDWGHPLYFSRASDPLYRVQCVKPWSCEIEGARIRIPAAARPAGGGDGHLAVIDQAARWEYDLWQVRSKRPHGGTLRISHGGRTRIGTARADGLGSNATAAHFALAAGIVRPPELAAGRIDHALAMTVRCTNGRHVWPATGPGAGRTCASLGLSDTDAPAMGQRFFLAMGPREIAASGVPGWQKAILRAMARYGMFVTDTGGASWGLKVQSGTDHTSLGLRDPWVALGERLDVARTGRVYRFDFGVGIDWAERLRVAAP